jgi:hypothetical protein
LAGEAQPNRDPGLPALPQCAVEIGEVAHRDPVERRDLCLPIMPSERSADGDRRAK